MAYCRWSDCDVYVYESMEGVWVIHVASMRRVGGDPPPLDFSTPKALAASMKRRNEWYEAHPELESINLPYDGASFAYGSPGECADQLAMLASVGYDVPDDVITELHEEQRVLDAEEADLNRT